MDFTNKKILVTGGTGLVGKQVVAQLLESGAHVICFTRAERKSENPNLTYIRCDLKQLKELDRHHKAPTIDPVDYILYLAANIPQYNEEKETIFTAKENTLDPFVYFLKLYGHLAKKIIYTSTIDIYGYPDKLNFDESTIIDPPTPYALAKYAGEEYLKFYAKTEHKQYVVLRFSQVYGIQEPFVRVIPFIIEAALHNKTFTMWGNPGNRRKFLFAADAARAVLQALTYDKNDIFHIAGSEEIAIEDIVKTVEKITGKPLAVNHQKADSPEVHIIPSTEKAKKLLNFEPSTLFYDGVKEVITTYYEKPGKK